MAGFGPGTLSATIERKRSGNYSGKATGRTETWNGIRSIDLRSSIEDETIYNVSCYVQVGSGTQTVGLKLKESKSDNWIQIIPRWIRQGM